MRGLHPTVPPQTAAVGRDLDALPVETIESKRGWQPIDCGELWRYRELLFFFAWRDLKVRYKQTELGAAWVILQPLATTGVFVLLFQMLMGSGKEPTTPGVPYALSTFCGAVVWQLFADGVSRSGESLLGGTHLITKVYFPRVFLPLSSILTCLVDFAVAFVALVVMMAYFGHAPAWTILTFPLFVMFAAAAALAIGLWLSALSAMYRDFRYVQPFVIRIGMFVSPVVYTTASISDTLPPWAMFLYGLNPMVGAIEGARWALFGESALPGLLLIPSVMATALLLVGGMFFFRRMEQTIADVI
jgi:lipopolysaccharide transport system permease protein